MALKKVFTDFKKANRERFRRTSEKLKASKLSKKLTAFGQWIARVSSRTKRSAPRSDSLDNTLSGGGNSPKEATSSKPPTPERKTSPKPQGGQPGPSSETGTLNRPPVVTLPNANQPDLGEVDVNLRGGGDKQPSKKAPDPSRRSSAASQLVTPENLRRLIASIEALAASEEELTAEPEPQPPPSASFPQSSLPTGHGSGQALAAEHPIRQPRGPPAFDELRAKPTARYEGSKNFARAIRDSTAVAAQNSNFDPAQDGGRDVSQDVGQDVGQADEEAGDEADDEDEPPTPYGPGNPSPWGVLAAQAIRAMEEPVWPLRVDIYRPLSPVIPQILQTGEQSQQAGGNRIGVQDELFREMHHPGHVFLSPVDANTRFFGRLRSETQHHWHRSI